MNCMRRAVSPAAGPEQLAVAAESRQYLWSVAARILGEEEQTALWLHYVEEMPVGEIAAVLDRSSVAVKTMMFRARKKLLPLVGDLEPEGRRSGRQTGSMDTRRRLSHGIDRKTSRTIDDPLAEPMRREAQRTRPEFSAALHARLRAAVRSCAAAAAADRRLRAREFRGDLLSWAIAAAASIALLVGSALFCHTLGTAPGHSIVQTTPSRTRQTGGR